MWVSRDIILFIEFIAKIFWSAFVMGVYCRWRFGGWGECGELGRFKDRVGLGAFKDRVGLGAFKDRVGLGAFKHIVIFDFLCLRYVWYYICKILRAPKPLSIRGGVKTQSLPSTQSIKSCRILYAY